MGKVYFRYLSGRGVDGFSNLHGGGESDRVSSAWDTDADRRRVEISRDAGRLSGSLLGILFLLKTVQAAKFMRSIIRHKNRHK